MLRRFVISAALVFAAAGFVHAGGSPKEGLDQKIRTNTEFLKAAEKIIREDGSKEGAAILKLAEESHSEAMRHLESEEYEFAREDLNDSIQKAMHAIVLSRNANDAPVREIVLKEEMTLLSEREHERKEARLKKGMAEVEIFIKTAERLLKDKTNEPAAKKLAETKALYAASRDKIALGDYDSALEGISMAYKLATASVKEIKRTQGDILTFPKAAVTEPKEILAHELKKNDAYAFFASAMVKDGQDGPGKLLSNGLASRERALKAIKDGGETEAIEGLRASTDLLIQAIKASGN